MTFGSQTDEPTARRMINLCLDRGINFFDTANSYNKGESERILGNVLKGRRGRIILASKVGTRINFPPETPPLSRASILANIDASLKRLQTDYLDIYYLHLPDYATPIEETLEAMEQVVRAGKVRYPGTSNYAAWQVCQKLWIADKKGYKPTYTSQPMLNLLARGIEQEYVPFCKEFGVSMIVYNPLAGGMLTGKQHRERPLAGTRFDNNRMYLDRYWHPAYFDAVDELKKVSEKSGRSLIDIALNWLLFHTPADCVILGASKMEHLEQNLDVFGRAPLPDDVLEAVDRIWHNLRGVTPKYNR